LTVLYSNSNCSFTYERQFVLNIVSKNMWLYNMAMSASVCYLVFSSINIVLHNWFFIVFWHCDNFFYFVEQKHDRCHYWSRNCLPVRSTYVHFQFLVGFMFLNCLSFFFWYFQIFLIKSRFKFYFGISNYSSLYTSNK